MCQRHTRLKSRSLVDLEPEEVVLSQEKARSRRFCMRQVFRAGQPSPKAEPLSANPAFFAAVHFADVCGMFEVLAQFHVARGAMLTGPSCSGGSFIPSDNWTGENNTGNKLLVKGLHNVALFWLLPNGDSH